MTLEDIFWAKVDRCDPDHCWLWQGTPNVAGGYGRLGKGGYARAHRFAYELLIGPIPKGLTLDHLCRVRLCVNPKHLEPVTIGVNALRGVSPNAQNARKTHCLRGHPFNAKNTYVRTDGHRTCRPCQRVYEHNRAVRRAAA